MGRRCARQPESAPRCDRFAIFVFQPGDMDRERDPRKPVGYHLDLAFEQGWLVLTVEGHEGPVVRRHVAEVTRAAQECGLRVVVAGRDGSSGMLA